MTGAAGAVLAELSERLDRGAIRTDAAALAPLLVDHRGLFHGRAAAALFPGSTAEVALILEAANRHRVGVVPQGGNTSYCGGATPDSSGQQLLLSLANLNRIRAVDPLNYSMEAEAGCVLAQLQRAAQDADRLLPLSLGSEGSCQLGGNLSTNAGGTNVLRYGMTRDLVLGLEVVLPDGRVLDTLSSLRKDNTGYDIKSLFLGAEGTLGVITAASLRLFPRPRAIATAIASVPTVRAAVELLAACRAGSGDQLSSFELLPRAALQLVTQHIPGAAAPLALEAEWYVLCELSTSQPQLAVSELLEDLLSGAMEQGLVGDAAIAQNERERALFWTLRESIPEAQRRAGPSLKHDISVPVAALPEFVDRAASWVEANVAEALLIAYGHVGDGNLHFNVNLRAGGDAAAFRQRETTVRRTIHDLVATFGGSFSAEHGIGQLKIGELERYAPAVELELMRRIKAVFDPNGIMNPGKILAP